MALETHIFSLAFGALLQVDLYIALLAVLVLESCIEARRHEFERRMKERPPPDTPYRLASRKRIALDDGLLLPLTSSPPQRSAEGFFLESPCSPIARPRR